MLRLRVLKRGLGSGAVPAMRPLRPLRPWLLLLSVNSVASEFSEFSEYLNEFSELAEAYVRRLAKVPDWRQIPGDTDWFEGCGYGNYDIRGAIAAGLEHNKEKNEKEKIDIMKEKYCACTDSLHPQVRKHVAICLGHCGPPSCTLKMAVPVSAFSFSFAAFRAWHRACIRCNCHSGVQL